MQFHRNRATPQNAKGASLKCDACDKTVNVLFPWDCTPFDRQRLIREAADEHRRIGCTAGETNERRKYAIWYPRM